MTIQPYSLPLDEMLEQIREDEIADRIAELRDSVAEFDPN